MGQDDEWGKLTIPTLCLNWEHTVYGQGSQKLYNSSLKL